MSLFVCRNDYCRNLKENMLNDKIASKDLAVGITFLSLTLVGILGNFSLYHYLLHYQTECRSRAINSILKHLSVANSLVILSKGVPQTVAAFGVKHFFNDFGCKLLFSVQRVGRGMSVSSISLLSVFQTIMISPMNSCWQDLKLKAPKYIVFFISICWIMHMMVNFIFLTYVLYVSGKWNSTNVAKKWDFGYCSASAHETITGSLFAALLVFPEVSFSVLMLWASRTMVFILYRHKQRVQHIHRNNVSPRSSPETRATQSTLVLVSTFVAFQTLSSTFHIFIALFYNPTWWLVNTAALLCVCFPTVSPFLIMSRDSTVSKLYFVWVKNTKSLHGIRKMFIVCFFTMFSCLFTYPQKLNTTLRRSHMYS
ncbi:vomeronasal type-1 receptor 4-like [Glossophaga mutica]